MERVLLRVQFEQMSGCWLWEATLDTPGYPQIGAERKRVAVHRWVLEQRLGRPIKPRWLACHRCNTPCCVNPDHLYEGTWSDNARDRERTHGPRAHKRTVGPKLTAEQAREIFVSSEEDFALAAIYAVNVRVIRAIWRGRSWRLHTVDLGPVRPRRNGIYKRGKRRPFVTVAMRRAWRRKGFY